MLGAAGFAAAVLGIVLLVKTPEGTLRIESEAKNVQVEVVDEADRTTTVRIEEGENATQLRAGKYRSLIRCGKSSMAKEKSQRAARQAARRLVF